MQMLQQCRCCPSLYQYAEDRANMQIWRVKRRVGREHDNLLQKPHNTKS